MTGSSSLYRPHSPLSPFLTAQLLLLHAEHFKLPSATFVSGLVFNLVQAPELVVTSAKFALQTRAMSFAERVAGCY
ncbi:hypothetical protein PI125_g3990 [Phytophthora idaei]|nr:hypothetical protein PI125_g3990 [Phytophthora idaei]KAG3166126.1 hypothetical protein PI126_g4313 [Phytophthora idaei]